MPLTVLTDENVRDVLDTLTKEDVQNFHKILADALHSYSTANDSSESGCCAANQPARVVVKRPGGISTLFMPSMSDAALGVKVLTLSEASSSVQPPDDFELLSVNNTPSSRPSSISASTRSPTASTSTSSLSKRESSPSRSSLSSERSTGASSAPQAHPKLAEDLQEPLGLLQPSASSPRGSVTLLTPSGQPRAFINASTLTAFRTALASTLIVKARQNVHTLTVFGAGMQAYWHIFLTLLIRQGEIHHLHVVNRDFQRAQRLLMAMSQSENPVIVDSFLSQKLRPTILTGQFGEYDRLLKEHVRAADIIYCCTPSTAPLFPAEHLTSTEGRKKARYIAAIGSYKPHMLELHPDVLRQAVRGPEQKHSHGMFHHRYADEGGAIIVDTIDGCLKESGELIQAGISGQGVVEIGELVMLKRSQWTEKAKAEEKERQKREKDNKKAHSHGGHGIGHLFHHRDHPKEQKEKSIDTDGGLKDWLERGNVIYKSVGMGLMDLVVGMEIVRIAEERGFGVRIHDF